MAWPYDARDVTYAALSEAQSTNFNKIQDEINNIAGPHTGIYIAGISEEGVGTGQAAWFNHSNPRQGWIRDDQGTLFIPIEPRTGSVISKAEMKFNQTVGAAAWTFELVRSDLFFDTPTAGPSNVQVEIGSPAPAGTGWNVHTFSAGILPDTLGAESRWFLTVDAPNNGDQFAGVLITFDQLY